MLLCKVRTPYEGIFEGILEGKLVLVSADILTAGLCLAPAGMEIEGLSDDNITPPDVAGLNFDHLNLSPRLPVRSAVTINEHMPQDVPSLEDILQQPLQIPQSTGTFLSFSALHDHKLNMTV